MVKSQPRSARQKFWIIILSIVPYSRRLSEYKVGLSCFDGFVESYEAVADAYFWAWPLILSLERLHKMLKDSKDVQGSFLHFYIAFKFFYFMICVSEYFACM